MNKLLQQVYDLYVCGPREFFRNYIDRFWKRLNFDGNDPLDADLLQLGCSGLDSKLIEATRRKFDRVARNYS